MAIGAEAVADAEFGGTSTGARPAHAAAGVHLGAAGRAPRRFALDGPGDPLAPGGLVREAQDQREG
ncbi:hypothetical protein Sros01_83720 [Streptomyces roseochromogenus]|nr:hypothetical protein Sros01_83720 [Streptomyces roseochromogenus]